jgi:CRISPR-associated protein Csm2
MQVGKALAMQGLERAQLRRFYGDVLNIKHRFETRAAGYDKKQREDLFRDFAPEVKLLRAKVYYAHKRSAKIVPAVMKQFIEYHVNAVKTAEDFLAFCRHFEAVVAFHYAYSNSK